MFEEVVREDGDAALFIRTTQLLTTGVCIDLSIDLCGSGGLINGLGGLVGECLPVQLHAIYSIPRFDAVLRSNA